LSSGFSDQFGVNEGFDLSPEKNLIVLKAAPAVFAATRSPNFRAFVPNLRGISIPHFQFELLNPGLFSKNRICGKNQLPLPVH
jgi:hypothetical protein